jgi:hypothetical protein
MSITIAIGFGRPYTSLRNAAEADLSHAESVAGASCAGAISASEYVRVLMVEVHPPVLADGYRRRSRGLV